MPLARSYSPNPQAQKNQDVGPSPYQQMSSAFVNASVNPQLKALQYAVLPAVKGIPIFGRAFQALEWITDPIGELKKELNISPSIGGAVGETIVSHLVTWPVKVLAVGLGAASGGQISNSLVQNAITYEWANRAVDIKRNPAKFIVQNLWNGVVKGDWIFGGNGLLGRFAYDKTYLFYKAKDHKGERYARWRNNKLFENFNNRAEKYGVRLEGAEQRMGAYSFTTVLEDKKTDILVKDHVDPTSGKWVYKVVGTKTAGWVTPLKFAKVGWQIAAPTVVTAFLFPPAAPFVLAWQALNADWGVFVKKNPLIEVDSQRIQDDIRESGEFRGKKRSDGRWVKGGDQLDWHQINAIKDDKTRFFNKLFKNLNDFATIDGWRRTFITGETLYERALHGTVMTLIDARRGINNQIFLGYDPNKPTNPGIRLKPDLKQPGWQHVGFHKASKSNIYERVIKLSSGDIRVRLYKDVAGVWRLANNFTRNTVANKFWWAAFRVQQFGKTIVSRFGLPTVLAVVLPNPITYAYLAYSAFKGLGEVVEPLKWLGWKKDIVGNRAQLIAHFGKAGLHNFYIFIEENGTSFFRRLSRRLYSILSPFDRDVGVLRGLLVWRDAQWAKAVKDFWNSGTGKSVAAFLKKNPWIGQAVDFIRRIPGAQYLFKTGGFLLGGVKWVIAPGQALKDSIVQFIGWTISKGIRFALGKAFRAWFSKPLTKWLQNQIIKLPAGSLRRKLFESWLHRVAGHIPLPKLPGPQGFLGKLLRPIFSSIFNSLKQLIGKIIGTIVRLIVRLIVELVKKVAQVIVEGIKTIFNVLGFGTVPVWGPVVAGAIAILLVAALLALAVFIIIFLLITFLSSVGVSDPYQSPPVNDYLEIRKEVVNPKPGGALFTAGDTVEYSIKYKIKKPVQSPIKFEDRLLVDGVEGGVPKAYFDRNDIGCQSPVNITSTDTNQDPQGPSGSWLGLLGTIPNPGVSSSWAEVHCSAKIASGYTDGSLINHVIVRAIKDPGPGDIYASQFLYVNSGDASGWPVEHGCFTQGPNTQGFLSSHRDQEAVDIGSNGNIAPVFNVSGKPVKSTINGQVLLVCADGFYYNQGNTPGVCGGFVEGSYFTTGFGTYVIVKEMATNLSAFYAHLGSVSVTRGQSVSKDQEIGRVDNTGNSTGPHLHYAFTRGSGARMDQPFIPYHVPSCSPDWPDTSCADAFASIGEPSRVCF